MAYDWKTIVIGIFLVALAIYQFSKGDYAGGMQTVGVLTAALGVKTAVDQNTNALMVQQHQFHIQQQQFAAMTRPHEVDDKNKVK